ncbi:MAG: AI-2E family transporter [Chloroflexota bacterium]
MLENNRWFRLLIVLLVFIAALHLAGLLWDLALRFGDVIMVFLLAWLVALMLRPLARAISLNQRMPWSLSVAVVYLLALVVALGLGFVIVPLIVRQLTELAIALPAWLQSLTQWYIDVESTLPEQLRSANVGSVFSTRDIVAQAQQWATTILQNAVFLATGLAQALLALTLVLVISFYLTLDGERLALNLVQTMPVRYREETQLLLGSVESSFGGFLRGQLIQALIYAVGTAAVMWVAGLGYIALSTTIAALAMFVPFIGPVFALIAPLLLALAQGGVTLAIGVFLALFTLQQIVFNVISPKVMSEAVGLNPLLVLLAILVGGKAAGLAGALFGVPVAAVVAAFVVLVYRHLNPTPPVPVDATVRPPQARPAAGGAKTMWEGFRRWRRRHGN